MLVYYGMCKGHMRFGMKPTVKKEQIKPKFGDVYAVCVQICVQHAYMDMCLGMYT